MSSIDFEVSLSISASTLNILPKYVADRGNQGDPVRDVGRKNSPKYLSITGLTVRLKIKSDGLQPRKNVIPKSITKAPPLITMVQVKALPV